MSRPKRNRRMGLPPVMAGFKPFGLPIRESESIILLYEEYEAFRLADYENLTHEEAAEKMDISRPTFTRIYNQARKSVAKAFVEGSAIFIEGGNVHVNRLWYKCGKCYHVTVSEKGINECEVCRSENITQLTTTFQKRKMDAGLQKCICPSCHTEMPHQKGVPCREHICPDCGKTMKKG